MATIYGCIQTSFIRSIPAVMQVSRQLTIQLNKPYRNFMGVRKSGLMETGNGIPASCALSSVFP